MTLDTNPIATGTDIVSGNAQAATTDTAVALRNLLPSDAFNTLDREFAAFLLRLAENPKNAPGPWSAHTLALAAALVSQATREGHVCLHLHDITNAEVPSVVPREALPQYEQWVAELSAAPVVGRPGDFRPLILDDQGRLYLQRYWNYENIVARGILDRVEVTTERAAIPDALLPTDPSRLNAILDRYFLPSSGPEAPPQPDWQRLAVAAALTRRFCVISGGPGTGKTYTIAVLVAALLEYHGEPGPRIALAAPTGKAAVRLQESMQHAREKLPCPPDCRERLPVAAATLHRLLGSIPGSTEFRHDRSNPLPFDVIIIDEASMVDLALMARLLQACPSKARVILVGDMNQLASVEAGAVLGDICEAIRADDSASARAGPETTARTNAPLAAAIIQLRRNRRFRDDDGIAALSRALNAGDSSTSLELLRSGGAGALAVQSVASGEILTRLLIARLTNHFQALTTASSPGEALQCLTRFRILCALRRGPHGTETLNAAIEKRLRDTGRITSTTPFYPGRPILVLKNDYNLRLFNGDVGVVLPHPETRELRVWFPDAEGNVRDFAPGRLPEHETVFAMTIHKSQGSEFQDVLMILPERDSPVLTRELIYTGVTRARQHVELWLSEATFPQALARRTRRTSGLAHRLWGGK